MVRTTSLLSTDKVDKALYIASTIARCAFCLLTAAMLPGCMKVGPNFHPPAPMSYEGWTEENNGYVTTENPPHSQWWKVFNDPTLDRLIELSVERNYSLKAACYKILQARAILGISIGELFPQKQEVEGGIEKVHLSRNLPNSASIDRKYETYRLGGVAVWEIDIWGRFRRSIEASAEELCASVAEYQDQLLLLLGEVGNAYIELRTAEERIVLLEKNIALQERSLEIVDAKFRGGLVTELDYQQAKAFVTDTRAQLPSLIIQQRAAKNALALLLGLTPDSIDALIPEGSGIPEAPNSLCAGIPADLINRRPDIRQALHQTAAQSARIGVAISDLFPHFTIAGTFGWLSSGSTTTTKTGGGGSLISGDSFTSILNPGFSWAVWNYGRITNNIRANYAFFHQLIANYQNIVLTAYREVEDSLVAFSQSHVRVKQLEESAKAAERSVQLSNTQYIDGIADYTRVLNSEQVLLRADDSLALSRGEVARSLVYTYKALGGGWEQLDAE